MAYSSANDEVISLTGYPTAYTTSSMPTLAQVTGIIEMIDGEIDTALYALGITSTPTNASLLNLLAKWSAIGSAGLTLQRYKNDNTANNEGDWLYSKYEAWIDKLITDDNYKNMIKELGNTSFTGNYVSSNVDDTTHEGAVASSTTISYGVDGFKI